MAKRLLVLMGMLAVMLVATVSAFAQQQGPVTATGVLGQPDTSGPDPEPTYPLTDEETGTTYVLVSGFVDLAPFAGQRVTIVGVPIGGADDAPPALNVTDIQPVDGPPPGPALGTSATFDFELTVKGEPAADARFYGVVPAEGCISVPLADPDADGIFTGSTNVPRFAPGPVPPPDAEPVSLPVQIVQANSGAGPCNPTRVIKDFGIVPANDNTFRATVNFKEDRGGTTTPETGGSGSGGSSVAGRGGESETGGVAAKANEAKKAEAKTEVKKSETKELPKTGGATLPMAGVAGTLLVGGLLIRRLYR